MGCEHKYWGDGVSNPVADPNPRLQLLLDIAGAVGNPTGGGIHAKWLLARVDGVTWSAVGSLNGGEISYKVNCEVVLMVDQPAVYARLLEVF